ncbi:VOC family protein [Bowmanella yangjiangensis]|nr:VOC family protein [Bowmanella yangjiangensis]
MKNKLFVVFLISATMLTSVDLIAEDSDSIVQTQGLDHLGLSVTDLGASTRFFTEALGWSFLGENTKYPSTFVSDGHIMISLWQVNNPLTAQRFDRKNNVGLHHLAISVTSYEALDNLYEKLKLVPGVVIEFSPEIAYGGPAKHMMVREPSGNRIEFKFTP